MLAGPQVARLREQVGQQRALPGRARLVVGQEVVLDEADADVVTGLTGGADDYIIKPFAPRELIARINVALIKAGKQPVAVPEA